MFASHNLQLLLGQCVILLWQPTNEERHKRLHHNLHTLFHYSANAS